MKALRLRSWQEWHDLLPKDAQGQLAANFDTRGSSASGASPSSRKRPGSTRRCRRPLIPDEVERATAWGRQVASAAHRHVARSGREQ